MRMGGGRIPTTLFLMLALGAGFAAAGRRGATARYLGGTLPTLEAGISGALLTDDPISLAFECRLGTVRVPYERVNLVEYGQQVDRRVLEALLIDHILTTDNSTENIREYIRNNVKNWSIDELNNQ